MRETSGTTWTFQMIIFFILLFAAFLTLVLNYNKAYLVKNETLNIIEKYDGMTNDSINVLNSYLNGKGYKTRGNCPPSEDGEVWYGASSYDGTVSVVNSGSTYLYCYNIQKLDTGEIYYNIRLFYRFNLPIIGDLKTFSIKGRSNSIVPANDIIPSI